MLELQGKGSGSKVWNVGIRKEILIALDPVQLEGKLKPKPQVLLSLSEKLP